MSILMYLTRSISIPRYAPKLVALTYRFSSNTMGWICRKFEDPPVCKLKTEDPCDFTKRESEFKSMWEYDKPESDQVTGKINDCHFISMWENPCCKVPCPDLSARFDDLYYKESDKKSRVYTRTWEECPNSKVICKKVCCLDKIEPPEFERRCLKRCPTDSCPPRKNTCYQRLMCLFGNSKLCPRTAMPCCRPARYPPYCKRERFRVKCKKRSAQYPSYSECCKCKLKPLHPTECRCLDIPPWCLALRAKRT